MPSCQGRRTLSNVHTGLAGSWPARGQTRIVRAFRARRRTSELDRQHNSHNRDGQQQQPPRTLDTLTSCRTSQALPSGQEEATDSQLVVAPKSHSPRQARAVLSYLGDWDADLRKKDNPWRHGLRCRATPGRRRKPPLHRWTQIVGKIRLELSPTPGHYWHTVLYVGTHGLTTSPIPYGAEVFQVDVDF